MSRASDEPTQPSGPRPVAADPALTRTGPARATSHAGGSSGPRGEDSSGWIEHGRFPPGHVLAGRYRIIELLGRGGMGEVYRADDLLLNQSVAVKFISRARADDAGSLAELVQEVRIARQISHPNVCRVHDMGEFEGHAFITMEYIDGENVASLIKRIGRLSPDKSLDIARQLCMALSAAHEQGILHRDLKPSNVMIDGRGKVRITDFGLAGIAAQIHQSDVSAGTPAYMAPEQLAGREVTRRSDIYALGLVLYEIFTGKRAFEADSVAELSRLQSESTPTRPSRLVSDLDQTVERVILRCLDRDPAHRPGNARDVLTGLPGFDPLAAALAAGETPSPSMVAQAGPTGGLPPLAALGLAWFVVVGLLLYAWAASSRSVLAYSRVPKPANVLADRAREMLAELGYPNEPVDRKFGFALQSSILDALRDRDHSPQRWNPLREDTTAAIRFWYRESPAPLIPYSGDGRVTSFDPPPIREGMTLVELSPAGRLMKLYAVPQRPATQPSSGGTPTVDWGRLFAQAGLTLSEFSPAAPGWIPQVYADERLAWSGRFAHLPDQPVTIEAAAVGGVPVFFEVVAPWNRRKAESSGRSSDFAVGIVNATTIAVCLIGAIWLARRNLRLGRGDLLGANRISVVMLASSLIAWIISASHVTAVQQELNAVFRMIGLAGVGAGLAWLLYLALEPIVRKRWPDTLISWTRLIGGRWRDPTVGRDVLLGAAIAVTAGLLGVFRSWIVETTGLTLAPAAVSAAHVLQTHYTIAMMFEMVSRVISAPMFFLMLLVLVLIVVRQRTLAVAIFYAVTTVVGVLLASMETEHFVSIALLTPAVIALFTFAMIRFGLLSMIAAMFFYNFMGLFLGAAQPGAWYATNAALAIAVLLAIAGAAFYTALAGQPIFSGDTLD